ncbi:hypothetical protein GCM10017687_36690 [Streptomyces echinatus]
MIVTAGPARECGRPAASHWVRTPDGRLCGPIEEARRCYGGHGALRLLVPLTRPPRLNVLHRRTPAAGPVTRL